MYRGNKSVKLSQHYPAHLGVAVAKLYRQRDASLKADFATLVTKVEAFAIGKSASELLHNTMTPLPAGKPGWSEAGLVSVLRFLS